MTINAVLPRATQAPIGHPVQSGADVECQSDWYTAGTGSLSTFAFERHPSEYPFQIRVVEIDGNPWFVAKDICEVLGHSNTSVAVRPLSSDERGKSDLGAGYPVLNIITESGLYKLIMLSDKPVAKPFQDWVTRDVLPAIRKDGMYVLGEEKVATGEMSIEELALAAELLRGGLKQSEYGKLAIPFVVLRRLGTNHEEMSA